MSEEINVSMIPFKCPSCGKKSFIELNQPAPVVTSVIQELDAVAAKHEVLSRLPSLGLTKEVVAKYKEWLMREDVVFSTADIEDVIKSFLTQE